MKILLIGANGTIGKVVKNHLDKKHQVIASSRSSSKTKINIESTYSILAALESVGPIDSIVCIAGEARWKDMDDMTEEDYYVGIKSKLMGQVNLVRYGLKHLNPFGSITLTTGILADDPVYRTTSAAMVNGAIHSFVKAAALEMKDGKRINAVCCGLVADAAKKYEGYFPGHNPVPMDRVVNAYVKSIEGRGNGLVIREY